MSALQLPQEEAYNEQVEGSPFGDGYTSVFDDENKEMQMKTRDRLLSINVSGIWDLFPQL